MGSHNVTCHPTQVNAPRLNPSHAGRYSIYLPRRDGRLGWPWCWLYTKMIYLYADSHPYPSSNYLIATRPGVEPTTSRSQVQRPKFLTVTLPSHREYQVSKQVKREFIERITLKLTSCALRDSVDVHKKTKFSCHKVAWMSLLRLLLNVLVVVVVSWR